MGSQQKVNPNCVNASNPFHVCGDHCRRSYNSKPSLGVGKSTVRKGGDRSERWNADSNCVNASNPFHKCGDYCNKKQGFVKKTGNFGRPDVNGGKVTKAANIDPHSTDVNGRRVIEAASIDPHCINASNPFHQCTNSCGKRKMGLKKQVMESKKAQNGEANKEITRKVDPSCINGSNPFHQCTERCSNRMHGPKR